MGRGRLARIDFEGGAGGTDGVPVRLEMAATAVRGICLEIVVPGGSPDQEDAPRLRQVDLTCGRAGRERGAGGVALALSGAPEGGTDQPLIALRPPKPLRARTPLRPGRKLPRGEVLGQQRAVADVSGADRPVADVLPAHLVVADVLAANADRGIGAASESDEQRDVGDHRAVARAVRAELRKHARSPR